MHALLLIEMLPDIKASLNQFVVWKILRNLNVEQVLLSFENVVDMHYP